ncbi:MAG: thiamine phosphate synthase, partial [Micromonosporaceae bacterium]
MSVLGRLHLITDTRRDRNPLDVVRATLRAGVEFGSAPTVQVRVEDTMTDRDAYDLALRVVDLCRGGAAGAGGAAEPRRGAEPGRSTGLTAPGQPLCLINDRLHIALAVSADGCHVGADDLPVAAARRVLDNHPVRDNDAVRGDKAV